MRNTRFANAHASLCVRGGARERDVALARTYTRLHARRFSNINDRCWPVASSGLLASG